MRTLRIAALPPVIGLALALGGECVLIVVLGAGLAAKLAWLVALIAVVWTLRRWAGASLIFSWSATLGIVAGGSLAHPLLDLIGFLRGVGWAQWPIVTAIFALVVWALFRPLSEMTLSVVREIRQARLHRLRFGGSAAFTLGVIAFIAAAVGLSLDWPAAAKPVPLTACYIALIAAVLNLVNELFGQQRAPIGNADGGVGAHAVDLGVDPITARLQAFVYFAWLVAFLLAIWVVGFLSAIAIFVFAYMCIGFGEPAVRSGGLAAATAFLCYALFDRLLAVAWPASLLGDPLRPAFDYIVDVVFSPIFRFIYDFIVNPIVNLVS